MDKEMISLLKSGNLVIPLYLFKKYKDLKLSVEEFLFMMYLYNKGNMISFDIKKMSDDLGFSTNEVLEKVSSLSDKGLVEVKVVKNDKNVTEEIISLDLFYNKLSVLMMEDANLKKNSLDSSVFDFIQKEFSRTLGPVEIEIIKAWISDGNSDDVIKEAVKEAVFNGVYNLRYIDKILFEWGKKGIKTKEDVEKNRKNRRVDDEEKVDEEFFDYNWFEDDE